MWLWQCCSKTKSKVWLWSCLQQKHPKSDIGIVAAKAHTPHLTWLQQSPNQKSDPGIVAAKHILSLTMALLQPKTQNPNLTLLQPSQNWKKNWLRHCCSQSQTPNLTLALLRPNPNPKSKIWLWHCCSQTQIPNRLAWSRPSQNPNTAYRIVAAKRKSQI